MAISMLGTGTYLDSDLADGYVRTLSRSGAYRPDVYLSRPTYSALGRAGLMPRLYELVQHLADGVHLLPRSVIEPEAADDLRHAIALADLGPSDGCVMPGCLQDVVDRSRGFSLCAGHEALMADWDSLTA